MPRRKEHKLGAFEFSDRVWHSIVFYLVGIFNSLSFMSRARTKEKKTLNQTLDDRMLFLFASHMHATLIHSSQCLSMTLYSFALCIYAFVKLLRLLIFSHN